MDTEPDELWAAYDWAVRKALPGCADRTGDHAVAAAARSLPRLTPQTYVSELVHERIFRVVDSPLKRVVVYLLLAEDALVEPRTGLPRPLGDAADAAARLDAEMTNLIKLARVFLDYEDQVVRDVVEAGLTPIIATNYRRIMGLPAAR